MYSFDPAFTSDKILGFLARADELLEQGRSIDDVCHCLGVAPATYHIWRRAHSRTFLATARRLEALEKVHACVLDLLTEQQQEVHRLQRLLAVRDSGSCSRASG